MDTNELKLKKEYERRRKIYEKMTDKELEEEQKKVRDKAFLLQDNGMLEKAQKYIWISNCICDEQMRRTFREMPPEELFSKLENMHNENNCDSYVQQFQEKYLKDLPDIPMMRFEALYGILIKLKEELSHEEDILLFGDVVDMIIEMNRVLTDYYVLHIEKKYPDKLTHILCYIYKKPDFTDMNDFMIKAADSAKSVIEEYKKDIFSQEFYNAFTLFSWYNTWSLDFLTKKEEEIKNRKKGTERHDG